MSSRDDNIATQEKAAERLNAGDVDAGVDIMFAPDAVDHDPAPFQEQGREGYRQFFHYLIAAFPDFTITPERMVADADTIAFALHPHRDPPGRVRGRRRDRPPHRGARGCSSDASRTARSSNGGEPPTWQACSPSSRADPVVVRRGATVSGQTFAQLQRAARRRGGDDARSVHFPFGHLVAEERRSDLADA